MLDIVFYILVFLFGVLIGWVLKPILLQNRDYIGTIVVNREDQKTVYSLVLDGEPETIESKDEVVFKVDKSSIDPDRK